MNHETISQLCFSEAFEVTPAHTAAALFTRLPFGSRHAGRMSEVLASAALLAQLESICIDALQPHVGGEGMRVLGRHMALDHRGAAAIGECVVVSGFVVRLGERSVEFHVSAQARGAGPARELAQGTLAFVIGDRDQGLPLAAAAPGGPARRGRVTPHDRVPARAAPHSIAAAR